MTRMNKIAIGGVLAVASLSPGLPAVAHAATPAAPHDRAATPAERTALAAWSVRWRAKISADYFKGHSYRWVSQPFIARGRLQGRFICWNNRDGGTMRLQIVRENGQILRDTGARPCDWHWHSTAALRFKRSGIVRFRLEAGRPAHTTTVQARVSR
ncbi:hypothetical protein ACQEU6_27900 [Spirillospora sp. CA-108201]